MKSSLSHSQTMSDSNLVDTEVHNLNQRLHHLIQVIQQLTVARDLDTIMAAVRTAARQLTGADGATFVLRDQDQCYYADEDAISPLWKGGRFPMSACISGWVMLNQQSVVIEDIYADPRIPADAYRPTFVKSLAMVPIRTRDPIGAIGNYWATHHTPTSEQLELLQTLADTAAIALENVQLYAEQEQRIQEHTAQLQKALDFEALLKRITDKVRDSLDEHQILATVVQELAQGLDARRCSTSLYNLAQATATVGYEYAQAQVTVAADKVIPMAESPELYDQLLQGKTFQFCCLHPSHCLPDIQAAALVLACPIVDDQRVLGDIRLYRTAAPFTDLEVRLVQQVANQCAIALRQARLHEAVQAQVHELERLNQLKDDFLSTISHELRSPMATIKMAVQMLKTVLGVANVGVRSELEREVILSHLSFSKAIHYLQILGHECQRETSLINNLLDFVRLEEETPPSVLTDVVLQEWVPQVAESFRERVQQQQQQLHIHIPTWVPPLRTDLALLNRILTELVQNACKYTPAGETITIAVTTLEVEQEPLEAVPPSPTFLLMVSNSGIEISDRDREHIFDKFYRIPNSDPWKYGGTGLGLALVKRLVEYLAGSIEVTSSNNHVYFTVKLANLEDC
ncbi:GAF domain-containing protein [Pantanalinema sp. GBBB05]|uniref:GAF domain-containing sensor histidine kinase n=1 Tax=Pantanalinema sp. GBBB05 TaxID=2604139 RepID=UPI001DD94C96|nr:GAF domain-containing protein [Pantanalinema sp. GBBB05]